MTSYRQTRLSVGGSGTRQLTSSARALPHVPVITVVPCREPVCLAEVGEPCVSANGKKSSPHTSRRRMAFRARKQEEIS